MPFAGTGAADHLAHLTAHQRGRAARHTGTTSRACSIKFDFALLSNLAAERPPTPAARLCQHTTIGASHDSPALPPHRLPTLRAQDSAELRAHHAPPPAPQTVKSAHTGSLLVGQLVHGPMEPNGASGKLWCAALRDQNTGESALVDVLARVLASS